MPDPPGTHNYLSCLSILCVFAALRNCQRRALHHSLQEIRTTNERYPGVGPWL